MDEASIVRADDRKAIANRRNAKLSTGPRTEEGKRKSAFNALTHGLCAAQAVCTAFESMDDFLDFRDQFCEHYDPQDAVEVALLDRAATGLWRLRRFVTIEALLIGEDQKPHWTFCRRSGVFLNLNRYEAALEKSTYRAIERLEERIKTRGSRAADVALDAMIGSLAGG